MNQQEQLFVLRVLAAWMFAGLVGLAICALM
jgi:hypothetical protein